MPWLVVARDLLLLLVEVEFVLKAVHDQVVDLPPLIVFVRGVTGIMIMVLLELAPPWALGLAPSWARLLACPLARMFTLPGAAMEK